MTKEINFETVSEKTKIKYMNRLLNNLDYIDKKIDNLQDRIDKAIEYIYENAYDKDKKYAIDDIGGTDLDTLLNILKGDDNNEANNNN